MKKNIIAETEQFVEEFLETRITKEHVFHNYAHTFAVKSACQKLSKRIALSEEDNEILILAALFHDLGYAEAYKGHEEKSMVIAERFLKKQDYDLVKQKKVIDCIKATKSDHEPVNTLEMIIKDADLSNLAEENYLDLVAKLRAEWEYFLDQSYNDTDWLKLNIDFLSNHNYYTDEAKDLFDPSKKKNIKAMKKILKKNKAKKGSKIKEAEAASITNSKSAQMMFKTALRNHLDLSTLADNKANIMLSVNALIITIAMPMAASYIEDDPYLILPFGTLLITCLASMIYATLATRPIKMDGYTDSEKIKKGTSNLFFFGNFFKMGLSEYQEGMRIVISDDSKLENAIMRDLYFLGRSLGHKYSQLRVCYNIFMLGIVLTVIVFAISYFTLR